METLSVFTTNGTTNIINHFTGIIFFLVSITHSDFEGNLH